MIEINANNLAAVKTSCIFIVHFVDMQFIAVRIPARHVCEICERDKEIKYIFIASRNYCFFSA